MTAQQTSEQPRRRRLTAAVVVKLLFAGLACCGGDRPPDPFVGMYDKSDYGFTHDAEMYGFLWIEEPCVYLRMPEPIPIDIQSVADLDLDLEEAARSIAGWSSALDWSPALDWSLFSVWVPADVQVVSESEPAHRILLRLHRGSTRYDRATGQLWLGEGGPLVSGDFVYLGIEVVHLSEEYRSLGCDALGQIKTKFLVPSAVSERYGGWR